MNATFAAAIAAESAYADVSAPTVLRISRVLPGSPERVWAYLTDPSLRRQWLAAGDMTLHPGAPFELVWRNDELGDTRDPRPEGFPEEQRMASRIIEADPPRRLVFAWGEGDVAFDLERRGDDVLLTVTHRGAVDRAMRVMTGAGWHMHLDILVASLRGGEVHGFWNRWVRLRDEYERRIP